jgi:hypothetical protein
MLFLIMSRPSTLREAAVANARSLLAYVIRSYRRTGRTSNARLVLRNARLMGTYPAPVR